MCDRSNSVCDLLLEQEVLSFNLAVPGLSRVNIDGSRSAILFTEHTL